MKAIGAIITGVLITLTSCSQDNESKAEFETIQQESATEFEMKSMHPVLESDEVLEEFIACKATSSNARDCKTYLSKAACGYYQIVDFQAVDGYLDYDAWAPVLKEHWVKLGEAKNQETLNQAQKKANDSIATVAVEWGKDGKVKAVALIIGGKLQHSRSWGLDCPNSLAFFPNRPQNSFVSKSLNYAWGSPNGVELYSKE